MRGVVADEWDLAEISFPHTLISTADITWVAVTVGPFSIIIKWGAEVADLGPFAAKTN